MAQTVVYDLNDKRISVMTIEFNFQFLQSRVRRIFKEAMLASFHSGLVHNANTANAISGTSSDINLEMPISASQTSQ